MHKHELQARASNYGALFTRAAVASLYLKSASVLLKKAVKLPTKGLYSYGIFT